MCNAVRARALHFAIQLSSAMIFYSYTLAVSDTLEKYIQWYENTRIRVASILVTAHMLAPVTVPTVWKDKCKTYKNKRHSEGKLHKV